MIGRAFAGIRGASIITAAAYRRALDAGPIRIPLPPGDWKPLEETIRTVMAEIAAKRAWRARKRLRRRRPVRARRPR